MPKAKAKEPSTDMQSVQERIANRLASINDTTQQASGSNISVKGRIFRLPDGKTSPGPLNCIVVDYVNKNMYYEDDYVEGEFSPPDCFAIGRIIKEMKPHESVEKPINEQCVDCEFNQFGSKGRGKRCGNNIMLAILPEDFTDDSELFTLKVSATALQPWTKYVRELEANGVDPVQVVTSLTFEEGLSYPSVRFKHIGGNDLLDNIGSFLPKADVLLTA
jgi:hypothetical protein